MTHEAENNLIRGLRPHIIINMKQIVFTLVLLMSFAFTHAKPLYPDSETAKSEVELGVEGIQRLCPTGMWDLWTFRDIMFDRESNTVLLVIQLNNWDDDSNEKCKQATTDDALTQAERIVSDIKAGYEDLIANPRIMCDGDFMLYLSVGTLLKQIEKDDVKLRIMLLKPDYTNQVFGDIPLELSSQQLKGVKPKE